MGYGMEVVKRLALVSSWWEAVGSDLLRLVHVLIMINVSRQGAKQRRQ